MRTFISMRFVSLITQNAQDAISLEELQTLYNEFIDAVAVESFSEPEYRVRYNALSYTLIELKSLQKEILMDCEAKKKCQYCYSFIQSN